jgi:cell division septum initiation protein DivIVA
MIKVMFDAAREVSFRTRLLGFDRREVQAFIANIVEDYERARHELDQLRGHEAASDKPIETPGLSTTARDVQRVLEGAQRVADDIERLAAEEGAQILAQAHTSAADILAVAQRRAAEITADARRELVTLEARASALQAHGVRLRAAFEAAADTAAAALSELAVKAFVSEGPSGETVDAARTPAELSPGMTT